MTQGDGRAAAGLCCESCSHAGGAVWDFWAACAHGCCMRKFVAALFQGVLGKCASDFVERLNNEQLPFN